MITELSYSELVNTNGGSADGAYEAGRHAGQEFRKALEILFLFF